MTHIDEIKEEFDEAALAQSEKNSEIINELRFRLFESLPPQIDNSLEIGCGLGGFSRLLAQRSNHVLALDLSEEMIRIARERSSKFTNIDYQVVNVIEWGFPKEHFDCIVSLMVFHYLPIEEMLLKIKEGLRPGGVMFILDSYQPTGWRRLFSQTLYIPRRIYKKFRHGKKKTKWSGGPWRRNPNATFLSVAQFLPFNELRQIYQSILPGVKLKCHLTKGRYSAFWTKPLK